jgi:hypothetical protein
LAGGFHSAGGNLEKFRNQTLFHARIPAVSPSKIRFHGVGKRAKTESKRLLLLKIHARPVRDSLPRRILFDRGFFIGENAVSFFQ